MGWLKDWFDPDFKDGHREGDNYESNIRFLDFLEGSKNPFGEFVLDIYRVRNGRRGKGPVYTEHQPLDRPLNRRQVERALERRSDEWVERAIAGVEK